MSSVEDLNSDSPASNSEAAKSIDATGSASDEGNLIAPQELSAFKNSDSTGSQSAQSAFEKEGKNDPKISYSYDPLKGTRSSVPDNSNEEKMLPDEPPSGTYESSTIPPQPPTSTDGGGEWELLSSKIKDWFKANRLATEWSQFVQPLRLLIALVATLILIQLYGTILDLIAKFPLAPRLFELAGIIWLVRFSINRLIRSEDRQEVISSVQGQWNNFIGGSSGES